MEKGQASATAIGCAMIRAAHLFLDGEPKILRDELALGLSAVGSETNLRTILEQVMAQATHRSTSEQAQFWISSTRAIMVMRSRFAEDELDRAIAGGTSQYVILGAGLDSFALRQRPALANALRIFEVDHPSTQQWKRARIEELNIALPANLTFVPVDFERQTFTEGLQAAGYRMDHAGLFSWLGVTQYLTGDAILKILQDVANLAAGTEIVFEYTVPQDLLDEANRHHVDPCKAYAAERGEPWLSFFRPDQMTAQLQQLNYDRITSLTPEEAFTRYFAGRTDQLPCPQAHRLITARVGAQP
jgi:methyltransferase (TIGR00027 family)